MLWKALVRGSSRQDTTRRKGLSAVQGGKLEYHTGQTLSAPSPSTTSVLPLQEERLQMGGRVKGTA